MNTETANHIDNLLNDSGLFPLEKTHSHSKTHFDFSDEVILITGAAGTIGSGLVKQLLHCKFKKMVLIDNAESPLYELIKDLEFENTSNIHFSLTDITNKDAIEYLFAKFKPTIVFHTAAYKHVPLMEYNAFGAVKLNIFGTKLLADLSLEYKVKRFIFISTDKAVNPVNVMGLSKKIGENYLNHLNSISNTLFIITRFGNIFGSNGSVVPLFKRQIDFGYPITITDTSITRYFISKYKACQLILKLASNISINGSTYVFNMGEPLKINDILDRLILKCHKKKDAIKIKIIGLREGEKVLEELKSTNETLNPTDDIDILKVSQNTNNILKQIKFNELSTITFKTSNREVKAILKAQI